MHGVGNAAHLVLVWFSESDDEVREVLAEIWAGQCWARRGGERARAQRSNWRRRWFVAAAAQGGEGRKQGNEMWRWEAHGRALRLVLARSGPMWPEQAGRRRRAAPCGAESLKPVDYCSADSEFQN